MTHQARTRDRATRSSLASGLALALVVSVLVSCGTGEALDPVSGYPQPGENPQRGGEAVYGLESETTDLCPPQATLDISGIQRALALYDTLTRPAYKGDGDNPELVYAPYLAETLEPNADFTVWTMKMREGVLFHDGSELDAQTIKDNLDTYRGLGTNENISALLFQFVLSDIDGIEVNDKYTLTITTSRPWVALPATLFSSGRLGMLAQSQLQSKQCNTTPVGSGPFQLSSVLSTVPEGGCPSTAPGQDKRPPEDPATPGGKATPPPPCDLQTHGQPAGWIPYERMTFDRNPNYWYVAPDGKPYPYLDTLEYRPAAEASQKRFALQSGELDIIHASGSLDFSAFEDFRDAGQANFLISNQFTEMSFVQYNDSRAPFNDFRIRKALQVGTDRSEIDKILNVIPQDPANGVFAPGTSAYIEDPGWPEPDIDKAEALVEEYLDSPEGKAAFPGGKIQVELSITPDPGIIQAGQLAQARLKEFGIEVTLDPIEQVQLIQRAIGGDFDFMLFRNWPGGDPDINFVWWYCNGTVTQQTFDQLQEAGFEWPEDAFPEGTEPSAEAYSPPSGSNPVNFARYCDPFIDKALDEGRSETDPARRVEIYKDLNRRMADQGWWGLLFYSTWAVGFVPELHDIYGPNLPGPDGQPSDLRPWDALVVGHQVTGLWKEQ